MKLYVTLLVLNVCLLAGETGVPVQQSVRQVASNKTRTVTVTQQTSKPSSKEPLRRLVTVTGYCNDNCKICCGIYASKTPQTASGIVPQAGTTVACNFLKFGTVIQIPGVGQRRVEDRLHPRYKDRIDIYFNTHKEAKNFGKKVLVVTIHQTKK